MDCFLSCCLHPRCPGREIWCQNSKCEFCLHWDFLPQNLPVPGGAHVDPAAEVFYGPVGPLHDAVAELEGKVIPWGTVRFTPLSARRWRSWWNLLSVPCWDPQQPQPSDESFSTPSGRQLWWSEVDNEVTAVSTTSLLLSRNRPPVWGCRSPPARDRSPPRHQTPRLCCRRPGRQNWYHSPFSCVGKPWLMSDNELRTFDNLQCTMYIWYDKHCLHIIPRISNNW